MYLFKTVKNLQHYLFASKNRGESIGFVPTMGALHQGHISLLAFAQKHCSLTVCSIFVNPTQFNEKEDFDKYPRTTEADIALLEANGCHVLFLPDVQEIYPHPDEPAPVFDFGYLDKPMEGAHRPGHFNGVAQVVNRLLQIVQPHHLFMGQKDYQQYKIIEKMLHLTHSSVTLHMCPTLREPSGLAMSSRNTRLNPKEREQAAHIYHALLLVQQNMALLPPQQARMAALNYLEQHLPDARPEYLDIVNAHTLEPVQHWADAAQTVVCTAVRVGNVRLIDNLLLPGKTT
ncbi:pantoate--beta-alanine ligase [Sphingobacteriales bacterium UPWRP_1]|nr:pantoate--beta-alanine ligase [Sphingobacteriales bacterium TSM_CSM]PSJ77092.1 pantoate--beta-alanine ligase [Sphingobacteriales bacterium UPWRP_1]